MLLNIFKENNMDYIADFLNFMNRSVSSFHAISEAEQILINNGYKRVYEDDLSSVAFGDKIYFKRMDLSLVALNLGKESNRSSYPFHIVASHVDSPCFKVKPNIQSGSKYTRIDVEPYGGMIVPSWFDRPLSIAGRVTFKEQGLIKSEILDLHSIELMIPNVCIHFNRDINTGYNYNYAIDTQPFGSLNINVKDEIANYLGIGSEDILSHDLYIYNREEARRWGEYISSGRLDDLACVYTSLQAFISESNSKAINVLYLVNNEEVGSSSSTGADGDFLYSLMSLLSKRLNFSLEASLTHSFLVSADNGHAIHPNHPELSDSENPVLMNSGIVIKYNASNKYTSDGVSSSIFKEILNRSGVPYQEYVNRSDIPGGSTLGNILLRHTSMLSIDVGLAQLAMHSAYETMGVKDIEYAINGFRGFYKTSIVKVDDDYHLE